MNRDEHSFNEDLLLSTDDGSSELASAASNLSHELDDRSGYTEADETFADRSLSLDDGTDQQIPLADDDGVYEVEGADKPPPMMSRLAAGMCKSLTNLLSIFGGPVVENLEGEADEDGSYEGSVEDDGSIVTDASRSVNGSRFDGSVDASANASRADGDGDSYEADGADFMDLVEDNAREATNEFEGVVPEVEEEGHDNTPALAEKADEDVEIHSLLLDEASVVSTAAATTTTTRTRDHMQGMVIEEELAVVEIIQTHGAYEESDSGDELEEKEEENKVIEQTSLDKSVDKSAEQIPAEEEEEVKEEEEAEAEEEEEEEEVSQSYIDAMDKRLRALTKNELAAKLKPRGERTYGLKEELVVRLRNIILREEKEARQQQRSNGGSVDTTAAQRAQIVESNGAASATPSRKRGRPTKVPAPPREVIEVLDDDEEEQAVVAAPEPIKKATVAPPTRKVAKRRKAGLAAEIKREEEVEEQVKEEQKVVEDNGTGSPSAAAAVEYSQSMWPSLVPKTLPRAYEPSCGWDALLAGGNPKLLPFSLPDPDEVRTWDVENDESLRNQVALLRLWVLSQPINLEAKHSKSNPTFFEALEDWERPAKKETKKEQQERLQRCYGEWVYGMTEAPEVPLEKTGRVAKRR